MYDNVTLEDDVFCGPSMVFTNVYNPRSVVSRKDEYRNTTVEQGQLLEQIARSFAVRGLVNTRLWVPGPW